MRIPKLIMTNENQDRNLYRALSVSAFDSLVWFLQLSFGSSLIKYVLVTAAEYMPASFTFENELYTAYFQILQSIIPCFIIVSILSYEVCIPFNLPSPRVFFERINAFKPRLSQLGIVVIGLHFLGFYSIIYLQEYFGRTILTMDNIYDSLGNIQFYRLAEMWISSPIREELVFRAILVNVFYTSFKQIGFSEFESLQAQTFGPAVFFSCIHLANFVGSSFSTSYILLQIMIGLQVGSFYSMRFISCNNIWETIILHMVNNLFSSFTPSDTSLDITDPIVFLSLSQTMIIYLILNVVCWNSLKLEVLGEDSVEDLQSAQVHQKQESRLQEFGQVIQSESLSKRTIQKIDAQLLELEKQISSLIFEESTFLTHHQQKQSTEWRIIQNSVFSQHHSLVRDFERSVRIARKRLVMVSDLRASLLNNAK